MNKTQNGEKTFLKLDHLEKVYSNGEKAVYDFHLDIQENDFVVVVGPSGCGKSTTLRMIAGLEDISAGSIYMGEELLNYKPSKDRKMAIVFQSYALYPQMNVFDNIAFPLTINEYPFPVVHMTLLAVQELEKLQNALGAQELFRAVKETLADKTRKGKKPDKISDRFDTVPEAAKLLLKAYSGPEAGFAQRLQTLLDKTRKEAKTEGLRLNDACQELDEAGNVKMISRKMMPWEIRRKVYETANVLDLLPYLDKLPKELSGGQMQRVALGRAIVKNVPVFLMDEPLSNLDAKLRLTMRSEIVKLHNKIGATTIYVTHDQTEAMTMATKIVVMSKGFIQQIGAPDEIYNHPANIFVAKFIGSPSMNIVEFEFDRQAMTVSAHGMTIPVGEDFCRIHDDFYGAKEAIFRGLTGQYDKKAHEYLLKVLSATGESRAEIYGTAGTKKKENTEQLYAAEAKIADGKLQQIRSNLSGNHKLLIGVRPERIRIEKCVPGKSYENCIVLKPTACELLGAEYNVYFDCFDRGMVGRLDAKERITVKDDIAVSFSREDFYAFDPVTGDFIA